MPGFDKVAQVYDATRSLRPDVMAKTVEGIVELVGKSSLVDLGVGTGRFASPLVKAGVEVTGLDISLPMIRQAREKGVGRLALAAGEFAPFRARTFEYAMLVHVMHLVKDWKAVIREISRIAKTGLITMIGDSEGAHPRDLYVQLREKRGFEMEGLKMGERDMVSMVKPALIRELVSYKGTFDPGALLEEYSAKLHSITWDVPDRVNAEIVEELRAELGEKREVGRSGSLVFWNHDQLRRFDHSA